MIGTAAGSMVATTDLFVGQMVSVDHQKFEVADVLFLDGRATVILEPQFGPTWDLEVAAEDVDEPMWETV